MVRSIARGNARNVHYIDVRGTWMAPTCFAACWLRGARKIFPIGRAKAFEPLLMYNYSKNSATP